MMLSRLF